MTYEINVKRNEDDSNKKKTIALKATKASKSSSDEDESKNSDDEDIAMLTCQFRKFLQKKRRFQESNNKKFSYLTNEHSDVFIIRIFRFFLFTRILSNFHGL